MVTVWLRRRRQLLLALLRQALFVVGALLLPLAARHGLLRKSRVRVPCLSVCVCADARRRSCVCLWLWACCVCSGSMHGSAQRG
jgi:hypothetical protein